MAHDRHRADYFLDGVLAAWTDKWEGKVVVLAHVKAHAGITVNELADVEAKASLAEEISITVPESLSHASSVVVRPETTGAFSAETVRVRTWAAAAIHSSLGRWRGGLVSGCNG